MYCQGIIFQSNSVFELVFIYSFIQSTNIYLVPTNTSHCSNTWEYYMNLYKTNIPSSMKLFLKNANVTPFSMY